ncbi:GerMN domain-containing protein [Nostoc sp. FACHB-87]|uniref:GerMN domain-containing protein n=1 Tax=Nostocales TaxID=1161 RepID=UPI00168491F6|nr:MULTISPECIES: GerMN domain-containing protein [Nostocales]MBD2302355.1 GerMN domain-containing protein [Nostoc sp. FACHB-190]MBD2457358.1 GerMN domain-containing protein [Nostoc sp. FACHB-87]MBD2478533.1 GerMN domain-containing protein [Anabaena sp. FACHB-83]MBD2491633.1 GerMN domain-containing protein [Aulosira sp. FACHB-615]
MNDEQKSNRISSGVVAAVSAAVIAVSGGVAWLTTQTQKAPVTTNPANPNQSLQQQPTQPSTTQQDEKTAQVYWLKPKDKNIALVPKSVEVAATQPNQALERAFQALLEGPSDATDSTTIPKGTKLLSLKVEGEEVHVNLSDSFTSGGGSTSMVARVGQVVYTASSLNPKAKVYIDVNGKPLDVLGGEGVELEQPLTRESFDKNYPL